MYILLIIIAFAALMIYMFATADNPYIFLRDRPQPWESKRKSINYYAWRGPMFVEDFRNFEGDNNPMDEIVPSCHCCQIPHYNMTVPKSKQCHTFARNQCRVRTQTAEKGWKHEYWNSAHRIHPNSDDDPIDGMSLHSEKCKMGGVGNFAQVTNNNLDAPNNLPSAQMRSWMGDWFNDCEKISPWCYAETYKKCMENENC